MLRNAAGTCPWAFYARTVSLASLIARFHQMVSDAIQPARPNEPLSTAIFIDVYLGVGEHIWRWFEGDPHQGS